MILGGNVVTLGRNVLILGESVVNFGGKWGDFRNEMW